MTYKQTNAKRVANQWLSHTAGRLPIAEALSTLIATSETRYPEEAHSEITDTLDETITEDAATKVRGLAKLVNVGKGKATATFGSEDRHHNSYEEEDGSTEFSWSITFPSSITLRTGYRSTVVTLPNNIIRDHKLDKKAVAAFLKDQTVQAYIENQWLGAVKDSIGDLGEDSFIDRAREMVSEVSDYDITATDYDDEGNEEVWPEGPSLRFNLSLRWKGAKLIKGGLAGGKLSFHLSAEYRVSMGQEALEGDYDYSRIWGM